jgi:hypothetical protein
MRVYISKSHQRHVCIWFHATFVEVAECIQVTRDVVMGPVSRFRQDRTFRSIHVYLLYYFETEVDIPVKRINMFGSAITKDLKVIETFD